jgi:hypothetical protein
MDTIWELRGSVIPALTLWTSTTARARSTTFFATQGTSPLFQETEAFVAEMGQKPDGLRNLFRSALASPLRARPWCVEPLVRPRKRLPHLLRPLVRPPTLSRGGAWRVGTFGLGRLNTGPLPRPAPKLVMQPTVQLPPSFAAGALFVHPIFAAPIARCAGAGDRLHLNEQADRQRRNL